LVGGRNTEIGTVVPTRPARAGGALVTLTGTGVASIPPSVPVPAGATSATSPITPALPSASAAAILSACFGGHCVSNTLFISLPAGTGAVSYLTGHPARVTGGRAVTGTITLRVAGPAGGDRWTRSRDHTA